MGVIWLLKALTDISVYYVFAAPAASFFGSTGLIWTVLLQAGAYAIARSTKHKWLMFLSVCAVALSYWLCRAFPADLIAQTPALVYLIWQYASHAPLPELSRQRTDFERLWKLVLFAAIPTLFFEAYAALISFGLLAFAAGTALLRTLRHNPETYLRRHFQVMNLGILSCVSLAALLLGVGPVPKAVGAGLGWFYRSILLPLLMWFLRIPGLLMQWLIDLLRPLMNIEPDMLENTQPIENGEDPTEYLLPEDYTAPAGWDVVKIILLVLVGLAGLTAMFLLFRKLGKGDANTAKADEAAQTRTEIQRSKPRPGAADTPAVQAVRKQYRRYLKLCVKSGIPVVPSSTSGEVCDSAMERNALRPHAGRIRQIYIRARYGGIAAKEDAKELSKLCADSKAAADD